MILSNQRLTLPGWVPVIGKDFYEIEAELQTAQSVTPGQGQTVNVAGVEVGEIKSVKLEDGRAIIGMKIEPRYDRVYRDATILLRPKTGLKDMVAELTPGTRGRGPAARGRPDPGLADAARRQPRRDPRRARRRHARLPDAAAQRRRPGAEGQRPRAGQHDPPDRADGEALAPGQRGARRALGEHQARDPQLLAAHRGARRPGRHGRRLRGRLQRRLRQPSRSQDAALRETLRELPSSLQITQTDARQGAARWPTSSGRRSQALRPAARALGPTQRQLRPFLRTTTPIIRDELRPFARAVAADRQASCGPAMRDLAAAAPDLTTTFTSLNHLLNMLAYNPPGETEEGYLFWLSWANHLAPTIFATQDAHGPIRHGLVVFGCQTGALLDSVAEANPQLGTLVDLLNGPNRSGLCPSSSQEDGRRLVVKSAPSFGRIAAMVDLRAVVLRPAAVPVAGLRRRDPAQAEGLPLPGRASPRRRSSPRRPTSGSPACRSARSRRSSPTRRPAAPSR